MGFSLEVDSDMEFSEACKSLVEEIQADHSYAESYALMLQVFIDARNEGETNRMAVALAKSAIINT